MTDVKRVRFEATINAPAKTVWDAMFGAETYPEWTSAFVEGSTFKGTWEQGSRMHFLAPSGDGMVAEIAEARPHQFLSIRHLGFVSNGVEDTESDAVRAWAPAYEDYTLETTHEGTRVLVDQDLTEDAVEAMRDTWAKALERLAQLCETR